MQEMKPIGTADNTLARIDEIKEFKPEGFARKRIYQTDNLHFNIYCIDVGQKNPLHKHPGSDEVLYSFLIIASILILASFVFNLTVHEEKVKRNLNDGV